MKKRKDLWFSIVALVLVILIALLGHWAAYKVHKDTNFQHMQIEKPIYKSTAFVNQGVVSI